jgi:hypothetical protein
MDTDDKKEFTAETQRTQRKKLKNKESTPRGGGIEFTPKRG